MTIVKVIDEFNEVSTRNGFTVLHAVPSILGIIEEVSAVRLINTGKEFYTTGKQKWANHT